VKSPSRELSAPGRGRCEPRSYFSSPPLPTDEEGYRLLFVAYPPPMDTSLTGSLTPVERPGFLSYVTITHT